MITQESVRDLFNYDPETGVLTNRVYRAYNSKKGKVIGSPHSQGYLAVKIKGKLYKHHRVVYLYCHGFLPKYIDHIDGDKLNNRIDNLRECTSTQNQYNSKISAGNTSGIKGVSWCNRCKRWLATVTVNGKTPYLGTFKNIKDAEIAVKNAREKLHKEFCNHG